MRKFNRKSNIINNKYKGLITSKITLSFFGRKRAPKRLKKKRLFSIKRVSLNNRKTLKIVLQFSTL